MVVLNINSLGSMDEEPSLSTSIKGIFWLIGISKIRYSMDVWTSTVSIMYTYVVVRLLEVDHKSSILFVLFRFEYSILDMARYNFVGIL